MAEHVFDADELRRIGTAHLESLRQAGIDWLPAPSAAARQQKPAAPSSPPKAKSGVAAAPKTVEPPRVIAAVPAPVSPMVSLSSATLDQRRLQLQTIAQEVAKCVKCAELASTRTQTVFADGQVGAELCFIGEAPGADEDAQGLPFVGAAGQLLNRIIVACGLKREEVYICNVIKCRPPGNRTPLPNEAANCRSFLERQLELIQPKFICTLGACAAQNLLGVSTTMGKLRGRFHDYKGIPVICTYHPAYLLPHRAPEKKKEVWEDMKTLMQRMGRTIPPKQGQT